MDAWVTGIGIFGHGFNNWPIARAILRGEAQPSGSALPIPLCSKLPAAERRRAGKVVNLALGVGFEAVAAAGANAQTIPTVFATSSADGENCSAICTALASPDPADHSISPTRFHNSVHNAAAGYWAIASGAMAPSTTLSAFDGSFSAAILEALSIFGTGADHVLATVFDAPYPGPLDRARPIQAPLAVALVLSREHDSRSLAHLHVSLAERPADPMRNPALEPFRRGSPPARGFPMLERIAIGERSRVCLDYLDDLRLQVEIDPI